MPEDIQERMHALIAQHGIALAALTALQQHLQAQRNDEQTNYLENDVPHIDVPTEFNQVTLAFAHEHRYRLQREQRGKQREQPSLCNDTLYCLETKIRQPRDDGIVDKWTQYVDFAARKCGSKNDRQSGGTITHNFFYVARMAKFCCRIFLQHRKSWKFF
jgi:hypothetical protein